METEAGPSPVGGEPLRLRIFINYRRGDTSGYAGRLYDSLKNRSAAWQLFMDIDTIEPGADFGEVIDKELESCDVVIAVIGRQWVHATDARGRRRIDNPEDFCRLELATALARNLRVIPALVQEAEMPTSEELPESLGALARRNAIELSDGRWGYDVDRLVQQLTLIQERLTQQHAEEQAEHERRERERRERDTAERDAAARVTAARDTVERQERERVERAARDAAVLEQREREAARKHAEQAAKEARQRERREEEEAKKAQARLAKEQGEAEARARREEGVERARRGVRKTARADVRNVPRRRRLAWLDSTALSRRKAAVAGLAGLVLVGGIAAAGVVLGSGGDRNSAPIVPQTTAATTTTTAPAPSVRVRMASLRLTPSIPVAGRRLDVEVNAVATTAGKRVRPTGIACRARAGASSLRGSHFVKGAASHCTWPIPGNAGGATLSGTIVLTYKGGSASKAFRARIARPPETLTIYGEPALSATSPRAGEKLTASVGAGWLQKNGGRRALDQRSTSWRCRATILTAAVKLESKRVARQRLTCSWLVPKDAEGKALALVMSVQSDGKTASRTFALAVAGAAPTTTTPVVSTTPTATTTTPANGQPSARLQFTGASFSSTRPAAGATYQATAPAGFCDAQGVCRLPVASQSRYSCQARIEGGPPVRATVTDLSSGKLFCSWNIPAGTRGRYLVLTLTISSEGKTASTVLRKQID